MSTGKCNEFLAPSNVVEKLRVKLFPGVPGITYHDLMLTLPSLFWYCIATTPLCRRHCGLLFSTSILLSSLRPQDLWLHDCKLQSWNGRCSSSEYFLIFLTPSPLHMITQRINQTSMSACALSSNFYILNVAELLTFIFFYCWFDWVLIFLPRSFPKIRGLEVLEGLLFGLCDSSTLCFDTQPSHIMIKIKFSTSFLHRKPLSLPWHKFSRHSSLKILE